MNYIFDLSIDGVMAVLIKWSTNLNIQASSRPQDGTSDAAEQFVVS